MSFSTTLNTWPLRGVQMQSGLDWVRSTPWSEIAAIYIPLRVLRDDAQTFFDFVGKNSEGRGATFWQVFFITFLRLCEVAVRVDKAECELCLEQVMDVAGERAIGYRFWLLYSRLSSGGDDGDGEDNADVALQDGNGDDDDGLRTSALLINRQSHSRSNNNSNGSFRPTLQTLASAIIGFRGMLEYLSLKAGETSQAALRQLDALSKGTAQRDPTTLWKDIHSYREWCDISAWCTGIRFDAGGEVHPPDLFTCLAHFMPDVVFEQDVEQTYPLQRRSEENPYFADMFASKVCMFPVSSLVYRVPHDIITVQRLYKMMLPNSQKAVRFAENELKMLLPMLARGEKGRDDTQMARPGASRPSMADSLVRLGAKRCMSQTDDIVRELEPLQKRARATNKDEETNEMRQNPTAYDPLRREVDKAIALVRQAILPNDAIAARKLRLEVARAAVRAYEQINPETPRMSSGMCKVLGAIEADDLLNAKKVAPMFRRPPGCGLSFMGAHFLSSLVHYELAFHVNHLHKYLFLASCAALDSLRFAHGLHMHMLLVSQEGGIGKSFVYDHVRKIMIPGTIDTPTYVTSAGFTGAVDAETLNPNQGDRLVLLDEFPASALQMSGGKGDDEASKWRRILSDGQTEVWSLVLDKETGKRTKVSMFISYSCSFFGAANVIPANSFTSRRFIFPTLPEAPMGKRHTADTMNQEALDPPEMIEIRNDYIRMFRFLHAAIAHTEKLIHAGALPEPSMHLCGVLDMAVTQNLRRRFAFVEPNISVFTRLRLLARQLCIRGAIIDAFLVQERREDGVPHRLWSPPKRITPRKLAENLERRLFVTVEHYAMAMGAFADALVDPVEFGVRQAIQKIFRERELVERVEHLYRMYITTETGDDRSTSIRKPHWDYNYASFQDMDELVHMIAMTLPHILQGFTTNETVIRRCLERLKRREITSHPFDIVPDPNNENCGNVCAQTNLPEKRFMVAIENKKTPDKSHFYIHMKYFIDNVSMSENEIGSTQMSPTAMALVLALRDCLNKDCMIPRNVTFSAKVDDPADVFTFHTHGDAPADDDMCDADRAFPPPSHRDYVGGDRADLEASCADSTVDDEKKHLTIRKVTYPSSRDFQVIPKLLSIKKAHKELADKIVIKQDLDSFACHKHNETLGLTSEPIPKNFDSRLQEMASRSTIESNDEPGFFGTPISALSADQYRMWIEKNFVNIQQCLAERSHDPVNNDADFDPDEFTYVDAEGVEHKHWYEILDAFPDSRVFGFRHWEIESESRLVNQYKQIAYHHSVREHLFHCLGMT